MAKKVEQTPAGLTLRESEDGTLAGSVSTRGKVAPTASPSLVENPSSSRGSKSETESNYSAYRNQELVYRSNLTESKIDKEAARQRSLEIIYEGFLEQGLDSDFILLEYDKGLYHLVFTKDQRSCYQITAFAEKEGKSVLVGFLHWNLDIDHLDSVEESPIDHIEVHPHYRRQGIATLLYREARAQSEILEIPCPVHNRVRTPEGDEWAIATGDPLPHIGCRWCGEGHREDKCDASWNDNYASQQ